MSSFSVESHEMHLAHDVRGGTRSNGDWLGANPADAPAPYAPLFAEPSGRFGHRSLHLSDEVGKQAIGVFARPRLAEMLAAVRLDVVYHRGEGDYLYYRGPDGEEIQVLDLLGGF